jgi:hypothetical protein
LTLQTEPVSQQLQERDWPAALADGTSQLVTPSAIQLVSTPLHLVGLDLFNRPDATAGMRLALVRRLYASSVALRFGRTAISFGMVSALSVELRLRTLQLCNCRWDVLVVVKRIMHNKLVVAELQCYAAAVVSGNSANML